MVIKKGVILVFWLLFSILSLSFVYSQPIPCAPHQLERHCLAEIEGFNSANPTWTWVGSRDIGEYTSSGNEFSRFKGDEYCLDGEWLTRTNLLASQLLKIKEKLSESGTVSEYKLFCDDESRTLNNLNYLVSYVTNVGLGDQTNKILASEIVTEDLTTENLCILNLVIGSTATPIVYTNYTITAASINDEDAAINKKFELDDIEKNEKKKLLALFKKKESDCDNIFSNALIEDTFKPCKNLATSGEPTSDFWFNSNTHSFIHSKVPIPVPPIAYAAVSEYFNSSLGVPLVNTVINNIDAPTKEVLKFGFPDNRLPNNRTFRKLNRIYKSEITKSNGTTSNVTGIIEETKGETNVKVVVVEYKNFDVNICDFVDKYKMNRGKELSPIVCKKNSNANDYYVLVIGSDLHQLHSEEEWLDLGSKLRVK